MVNSSTRLLVIDDDKALLRGAGETLKREGFQVLLADNGKTGIQLAAEQMPDLVICDLMMPPPDGLEVLKTLSANPATAAIPFVFLTARTGENDKISSLDLGADDYVTKPFNKAELLARVRSLLRRKGVTQAEERGRLENEISSLRVEIAELIEKFSSDHETLAEAMAGMLAMRDNETEEHTRRVVELSEKLAYAIGMEEIDVRSVRMGALLHDIGKVGIPDSILLKAGALTDDERKRMMVHSHLGYQIAKPLGLNQIALDLIRFHHERWDGSGYPDGLRGEQIPRSARIFAVVDVWDALTSDRPYRKALPFEEVCTYILEQSGSHFDPQIVAAFLKMIGR